MPGLLASEIMDQSAVILNDSAKLTFSYVVQLPWLKMAINDLSDELAVNSLKLTNKILASSVILAGVSFLQVPADTIVVVKVEERLNGSSVEFTEVTEIDSLPAGITARESIGYWAYQGSLGNSVPQIAFLAASTDRELRITYQRFLPYSGTISSTDLGADITWPAKRVLSFKTAELINKFVLMNAKRDKDLKDELGLAMYRYIQIWTHASQPIRKPSYRRSR